MGKHSTVVPSGGRVTALTGPDDRRIHRSRQWLPILAFFAAFAIVIVMVTDPYSGEYAAAATAPNHWIQGQRFLVSATDELGVARDAFGVQSQRSSPVASGRAPAAGTPSPGSAQSTAQGILMAEGLGDDQFSCLVALWNRESHWRVGAQNGDGAYGIPQALPGSKMASAGPDWQTSARTQILWGLGYIQARYGTPCGAWAHSQSTGWY